MSPTTHTNQTGCQQKHPNRENRRREYNPAAAPPNRARDPAARIQYDWWHNSPHESSNSHGTTDAGTLYSADKEEARRRHSEGSGVIPEYLPVSQAAEILPRQNGKISPFPSPPSPKLERHRCADRVAEKSNSVMRVTMI